MNNNTLKMLLKEYEQKRSSSFLNLEKRKGDLFSLHPRLKEIEDELNIFGIETAKNILNCNSITSVKNLEK